MKEITITAQKREAVGKKATKIARREGLVPCNIYGLVKEAEAFTITVKEANKIIFTPNVYLVNVNIGGTFRKAIIRETQFHPVKDNVLHIDFLEVSAEKPIVVGVPIQTEGLAPGVRAGGKLVTLIRKINVRAFYKDVPEKLTIDVSNLQLGKSIKVGDLSYENLELVTPKEVIVVSVKMTRAAISAAAEAKAAEE